MFDRVLLSAQQRQLVDQVAMGITAAALLLAIVLLAWLAIRIGQQGGEEGKLVAPDASQE